MTPTEHDRIIRQTVQWLEKAVIGLNLCPFAKAVHVKRQIRYRLSDATTEDDLMRHFLEELDLLCASAREEIDTTLLIHPAVLQDFLSYNDFVGIAEDLIRRTALDGVIQVASFHPGYRFAGTDEDDVTNCTNRSPYPMLHLLREDSITRAVDAYPNTERIVEANIERLRTLGIEGWQSLWNERTQATE